MPTPKKKKKLGRPSIRTPAMEAEIFKTLQLGLDYRVAAHVVGVKEQTINEWRRKDEDFAVACEKAVGNAKRFVSAALMNKIQKGNIVAIIFWLKTRTTEFREKAPQEDGEELQPMESFL